MFEIINNSNRDIEELDFLDKYVKYICKREKIEEAIFNIIFVSNEEIRELNKVYRGVDRVTDVISFALEDEKSFNTTDVRMLGDIYISIDKVRSQAKEYGHSFKRELYFLSVHGLLHLLGYDHMKKEDEEVMFGKQEEILDRYGIKREEK